MGSNTRAGRRRADVQQRPDGRTLGHQRWVGYLRRVRSSRYSWPQPINGSNTALVADCEDGSQTGALETATSNKKTVGTERSHKQGSLVRGADGIWRVQGSFFIKDTPC